MCNGAEERLLDKLLNDLEHDKIALPTLPEVVLRIRETLEDKNSGIDDIVRVISPDTALSARLIQIANSPFLRAARTIESMKAAVTRMGADMTSNLVISIAMEQMFQTTFDTTYKRLRHLWEHSTQVAALCYALATQFTKLSPDQALLAGLVHDIGVLPIITMAEDMPELLADSKLFDNIIQEAHPIFGETILQQWHFSPELFAVAAEHEDIYREHAGPADYVDVVIVANLESHLGSNHPHAGVDLSTVPAFGKLGLEPQANVLDVEGVAETKAALG